MMKWDDKPYCSLNYVLREQFKEKVYKLSLNAGLTCPNRDGTLGTRGCIFCSSGGSGDFAGDGKLTITEQILNSRTVLGNKSNASKYIAYYQAYTNTYASTAYLRQIFTEALNNPKVVGLSIATRPDCISESAYELLYELNQIKPIWIELGLQTIHGESAVFIRRGYPLSCFEEAVYRLKSLGIQVVVHTILGLPRETNDHVLATMRYLNRIPVQGIKLQLLHILRETDLAAIYEDCPFRIYTLEEYADLVVTCIENLSPHIVIHRLTGDGPKRLLIAPKWSSNKKLVLNTIQKEFRIRKTWQGRCYDSKCL